MEKGNFAKITARAIFYILAVFITICILFIFSGFPKFLERVILFLFKNRDLSIFLLIFIAVVLLFKKLKK